MPMVAGLMDHVPHSTTFSLFRSAHLYFIVQSEVQQVGSRLLHLIKAKESSIQLLLSMLFQEKVMI